jgi:cell division protein FtsX
MVGVVTLLAALLYLRDTLLHWWQYIALIFVITVTVLLPFILVFTCAALTKVATELTDDIEKVRNEKYGYQEFDGV